MNTRSRAAAITAVIVLAGCADGAKLVQEHDLGGVVVYPFREDQGSLLSSFRKDALALMQKKCAGGTYAIVREGEARSRARVVSPIEGREEVVQERRWGIQFRCK
ncbi:MAG TPA: hypothetical protein VD738_03505 [Nitrospira sp.]|nr:hypothetical protein [Nitrospira sp.]